MRLLATPRFGLSSDDLTALACAAEAQNMEQRFRALVQAGVAPADTPRSQWGAVVREHRDQVANAVFLPDLLMQDNSSVRLDQLSAYGRHAVEQAVEALRLVKKSPTQKRICHFDDFVVHNFLEQNINDMEMRRFFENTLGELYRYDKDFGTELVLTLEAWIENNLNIAKTSRYLYAHRNTILYRMERISSILNSNLKDANELLKYQLALKIYRLLDL